MLNNGIHRVVLIIIILYMISKYFKTTENFKTIENFKASHDGKQVYVLDFDLMTAASKIKYSSPNYQLKEDKEDRKDSPLDIYKRTNGVLTKLDGDLTIDFKLFNNNNLTYYAIFYNEAKKNIELTFNLPTYDNDLSNNRCDQIPSKIVESSSKKTYKLGSFEYCVVYFLPLTCIVGFPVIDYMFHDYLNVRVITIDKNITFDASNFQKKFNSIIYNPSSSNYELICRGKNKDDLNVTIPGKSFYLIQNNSKNFSQFDEPLKIDNNFGWYEINPKL